MKIAYLTNRYPRNSHSFIRREILALEALGHEVMRFSQRPLDEPLASEIDKAELKRTRVILSAGALAHIGALAAVLVRRPRALARAFATAMQMGWRAERGLLYHVAYLAEAAVLERWLRHAGATHLHAHFGTNSAAVALLCHALGGPPFSFTVHGPDEFDKPEFLALGTKIAHAAFVVGISSFGRAQLWRWSRFQDWGKVHVVTCGLDEDLLRASPTPVPERPRLVCVARLSPQKGHMMLVEAADRLARSGRDFEILLVGDGPLRAEIEGQVRSRGLEGRVRVTGWMSGDQVRATIVGSRALLLPSFAEGLPVVVMEALALRRPVITTAIAGTPELVRPGVTGWLVPAGSVEALVVAMGEALDADPHRLMAMGEAGAALVAERHDALREAAKLASLFAGTIAAPVQRGDQAEGGAGERAPCAEPVRPGQGRRVERREDPRASGGDDATS